MTQVNMIINTHFNLQIKKNKIRRQNVNLALKK